MVDSHTHLNDEKLLDRTEEIVSSFAEDGIDAVVNAGFDLPSSKLALVQAERYDGIFCTVGCHPHDAKTFDSEFEDFLLNCPKERVVALGEIGLDYYYGLSEKEVQKQVMRRQIELADALKLPLVLHIRDAHGDAAEILRDMKSHITNGIQVHCYSGSAEMVKFYLDFGAYFSFGGSITFKNAKKDDVIRAVPRDRLLLETDAPYMTPVPFRGNVNEPKYMRYTALKMSEILGEDYETINILTRENALSFFRLKGKNGHNSLSD
ncbi:MAG: TatD family hydrolase [Christensenellales bacterium]